MICKLTHVSVSIVSNDSVSHADDVECVLYEMLIPTELTLWRFMCA